MADSSPLGSPPSPLPNRTKGVEIGERTFRFAISSADLFQHLHRSRNNGGNILATQFLRSATSIGANVEEAQCAESRKDFIHKMRIAQKEARECRYWLRLLREADIIEPSRCQDILQESDEILKVISAIIVNAKCNQGE